MKKFILLAILSFCFIKGFPQVKVQGLFCENRQNPVGLDIQIPQLFQLKLTYADGTTETILSDSSWKSSLGSVHYSEIYNGQTIDARLEKDGWTFRNIMIRFGVT